MMMTIAYFLAFSVLPGAVVGLVVSIVWPRGLLRAAINIIVSGLGGLLAHIALERLFSALGVLTGLPIYQVFGVEAGKIIITACLKILRHASLIGGLIGVATLAIFYRDPAREVSPLRRIAECALAGALLTAGYLALSYAFLFSLLLLPAPSGG